MMVQLADAKEHLNVIDDEDNSLIMSKIEAAEAWIAKFIGVELDDAEAFPDGTPGPVLEAVRQLTAHLYENREATLIGLGGQTLPLGLHDLLAPYREWCF